MQAAPGGVKRCPNCGERLRTGERKVMLYFAVGALVLLLALIGLGMYILPNEPLG